MIDFSPFLCYDRRRPLLLTTYVEVVTALLVLTASGNWPEDLLLERSCSDLDLLSLSNQLTS